MNEKPTAERCVVRGTGARRGRTRWLDPQTSAARQLHYGRVILDGNSSWWVASLGHNHPRLVRALRDQAERMCHVALAGMTHEPAALLASDLVAVAPAGLTRVFFSDDGSTAVATVPAAGRIEVTLAGVHMRFERTPE